MAISLADNRSFKVFDTGFDGSKDIIDFSSDVPGCYSGNISDAYLHERIGIQLDLGMWTSSQQVKEEKWSLVFQKVSVNALNGDHPCGRSDRSFPFDRSDSGTDDMQASVPVFSSAVVQQLQALNEGRINRFINVVRLYRLEPIPQFVREWGLVDGFSFEFIGSGIDRKFNVALVGGGGEAAAEFHRLIQSSIEGGPELVKHLAQLKSEVIFGQRSAVNDFSGSFCPIAIHLYGNMTGFWIDQTLPLSLKSFRMHHGPIESLPAVFK